MRKREHFFTSCIDVIGYTVHGLALSAKGTASMHGSCAKKLY